MLCRANKYQKQFTKKIFKQYYATKVQSQKRVEKIDNENKEDRVGIVYRKKIENVTFKQDYHALDHKLKDVQTNMKILDCQIEPEVVKKYNKKNIPMLQHNLEKVIFEKGVHWLKSPNDRKYNYDEYLGNIIPQQDINEDLFIKFVSSSKDVNLRAYARKSKAKYGASTSSLTELLSLIYLNFRSGRDLNLSSLPSNSKFEEPPHFLRSVMKQKKLKLVKKGNVWYIENFEIEENLLGHQCLIDIGKSLEVVLTTTKDEFLNNYLKDKKITEGYKPLPGSHIFVKYRDLLVRSQLDCYHPDLPKFVFDLKTRATSPIRFNIDRYQRFISYAISEVKGVTNSYEREFYDMIRGTFIKYSFQARLGLMDGIFVTYHNTKNIFGFEYIPLGEIEKAIYETKATADISFQLTMAALQAVLNEISNEFDNEDNLLMEVKTIWENSETQFYIQPISKFNVISSSKSKLFVLKLEKVIGDKVVHGPVLLDNKDNIKIYHNIQHVKEKTRYATGADIADLVLEERKKKKFS